MGFIRAFRAETTNLQVQTSGLRAQLDSAQAEAQLTQSRLEGELTAKAEAVRLNWSSELCSINTVELRNCAAGFLVVRIVR